MPEVDGPGPLPDSSFTEGVYCVSGRIPALSVSDSLHRAHGLAFSPLPMPSLTPAGLFREVSLPSGPRQARPGCLTTLYTGLRKLLDQKRMCFVLTATFSSGEAPPHSPFSFRYDAGTPASTINEFLQTILPAFTIPTRTSSLFQPLRRYGRPMGKRLPSAYPVA